MSINGFENKKKIVSSHFFYIFFSKFESQFNAVSIMGLHQSSIRLFINHNSYPYERLRLRAIRAKDFIIFSIGSSLISLSFRCALHLIQYNS